MRKLAIVSSLLFCLWDVYAQKQVVVPENTSVFVKTTAHVESTSKIKNMVAYVTQDVVIDGVKVIKAETPVSVEVRTRKRKCIGIPGVVKFDNFTIRMVDGQELELDDKIVEKGESKVGKSIGLTVGMLFLIPPFNFLFLLKKGEECKVPSREFMLKTDKEYVVTVAE